MNTHPESASRKKLLILSVSAGAGHLRAAEALRETAATEFPGVEAEHVDLLSLTSEAFRRFYAETYDYLVEHQPSLWKYLYESTDRPKRPSKLDDLARAFERANVSKLGNTLETLKPDVVICTHFLPAQFLSHLIGKGRFGWPVWVTVTDFDVHALWILERITGYFAASDEVAWRMQDRGIERDRIHVIGIPVMPVFGRSWDRGECARELGLDARRKTVLLMAGAKGTERARRLAERLLRIEEPFQLVAIAGRNENLLESLKDLAEKHPGRLFPLGFTRTIERVMAASDLAVTKPGGLISSECLAMGLPMVLISTIPGQEERNATYLLESGAALEAYDEAGLEYRVAKLLSDPERLSEMQSLAKALGRPHAAREAIRTVLTR